MASGIGESVRFAAPKEHRSSGRARRIAHHVIQGPALRHPLTLHIGLPKTASTFLQNEIFPALARHVFVDKPCTKLLRPTPRGDRGLFFERALAREPGLWAAIGTTLLDELLGEEAGERPVLISDEAIGRAASNPLRLAAHLTEIDRLARARGFEWLQVMVVIREQAAWFASHFAQLSDRRSQSDQAAFEEFVRRQTDPTDGFYRFGALLQYDHLYKALVGALAPDQVRLLVFEELERNAEDFTAKIERFVGDALERRTTTERRSRNVQSAGHGRWMLRAPSARTPLWRLHFMLRGMEGRSISLTPELRRSCAVYGPGNAILALETGLDLAGYGYAVDAVSSA